MFVQPTTAEAEAETGDGAEAGAEEGQDQEQSQEGIPTYVYRISRAIFAMLEEGSRGQESMVGASGRLQLISVSVVDKMCCHL